MCSLLDESDCSAGDFSAIFMGLRHPITASGNYWSVNIQSHIVFTELNNPLTPVLLTIEYKLTNFTIRTSF